MAKISQILSYQQGAYKWRVRDCLLTAQAVIQSQGLVPPNYAYWHDMEESRAIRIAQRTHGSLRKAHVELFTRAGLSHTDEHLVGNILLLEGKITNNRLNTTIDVKQITRLGFVVDNYEVWTWFDFGLGPIHKYDVVEAFSCRQS